MEKGVWSKQGISTSNMSMIRVQVLFASSETGGCEILGEAGLELVCELPDQREESWKY